MESAIFETLESLNCEYFQYTVKAVVSPEDYDEIYKVNIWHEDATLDIEIMHDEKYGYSACVLSKASLPPNFEHDFMDSLIEYLNLVA
jgi:hypothetical protein